MGFTVLSNGDLEAAQKSLDEAHEINQQINNKEMEFVLTGKGILALQRGDYEQARAFLLENAEHLEEVGNRMGALWARARIAYVTLCEGNVKLAQQLLTEVIENFYADHNKSGVTYTLDKLASLYVMTDKPEVAAQLIGWSDATRKEIGDPRPRIDQDESERDIAAIKTKIVSAMFEAAYHAGQEMTLDSIVAVAIS
jgi:tetratricopeptide (TPR) repeat protein